MTDKFNKETEEAMREAKDIALGKIKVKEYHSAKELFDELEEEDKFHKVKTVDALEDTLNPDKKF